MKQILPYIFLLAGLPALAQQNTRLKINLTIDSSRLNHIDKLKPDTIKFYKLPVGKLAFIVPPGKIKKCFELSQMPVGKYRVTYSNLFMQKSTRDITLRKIPLNEISLCIDSLDSYPQNTLAKLQDKDSILLYYVSYGCGHSTTASIIITRDKDQFVARMQWSYMDHTTYISNQLNGKPQPEEKAPVVHTTILTDQQIKAFIKFENELREIKPFGSTTVLSNGTVVTIEQVCNINDEYTLKSNHFIIKKKYNGCRWHGFGQLTEAFFGRRYY
jgi:hypothetical protein